MKDAIFFNNLMGFFVLKIGEFTNSGIKTNRQPSIINHQSNKGIF